MLCSRAFVGHSRRLASVDGVSLWVFLLAPSSLRRCGWRVDAWKMMLCNSGLIGKLREAGLGGFCSWPTRLAAAYCPACGPAGWLWSATVKPRVLV